MKLNTFSYTLVTFLIILTFAHSDTVFDTREVTLIDYDTKTIASCGSSYFDSTANACTECPTNTVASTSLLDGSGNSYFCECGPSFILGYDPCYSTPEDTTGTCVSQTCTACPSGQASFLDRSACVSCDSSTAGLVNGDCACSSGKVLREVDYYGNKLTSKVCETCPSRQMVITSDVTISGANYKASAYKCQSCPDPHMTMSISNGVYVCTCDTGYTLCGVSSIGNQSCALDGLVSGYKRVEAQAVSITYHSNSAVGTLTSLTMQHYFTLAASRCKYFGGPQDLQYCQILANLCALQLFDDETQACIAHQDVVTDRGQNLQNSIENWVTGQPWLYYSSTAGACADDNYAARITLKNLQLKYVVAKYTMNGTFVDYSNIETLFTYCGVSSPNTADGGGTSSSTHFQVFGFTQNITYQCALNSLLVKEQFFYELYLYHPDLNPHKFVPIPVRIVGIRSGGEVVNAKRPSWLCGVNDVLVRRFFLSDIVSGITSVSSSSSSLQAMRYASYIALTASTNPSKQARILTPILTIEYTEVAPSGFSSTESVDFQAAYVMKYDNFFTTLRAFFVAYTVLTALLFALRYYNWTIRHARVITQAVLSTDFGGLNLTNVYEFCLLAMSTWVITYFWFTTLICWYFFVFFKIQTVPSMMLPPQANYYSASSPYFLFTVNLHVMAFFQLAYVLVMLYRQCQADLFFIDWEPAKISSTSKDLKNKAGAVSVWRTIMVANEWSELQSLRKTDIRFTLFALGLFLLGLNLQYNATPQPILADKSPGELNIILRFANTTFFWMIFSLGQYLWKFLIYERYISEPPERLFVDFCTIAKVSVIILDERYHGYYLHCRSPHQYADGTMVELVEMLHKEEAGLTVDRSLEGAPADVQTFQIYLTGEWRANFDKIYASLSRPITITEILQQGRNKGVGRGGAPGASPGQMPRGGGGMGMGLQLGGILNNIPPERVMKAWRELTIFLQEFVENNFGKAGLRRIVREPTYYEKLTGAGPDLSMQDQPSIFYTDRDFNYCKVLFLGREAELLLLDILAYSLFDLWFNNTAVSMALTYLLDLGLCTVRQWWGQAMISKKTMIDGRFLI